MGLACCARPPAQSTQRDLTWETNLFHVPGLAPQPADRMTFQQKIMEGQVRKVSSMGPNHMLLKKKPKRHQNTEQTLNREWSFGCAPKSTGSSSPAGLGGHRPELAKTLLAVSAPDPAKNVTMIRKCPGKRRKRRINIPDSGRNLASAKAVFEAAMSWRRRAEQLQPQLFARRARQAPGPEGSRRHHGPDEAGGHARRRLLQYSDQSLPPTSSARRRSARLIEETKKEGPQPNRHRHR